MIQDEIEVLEQSDGTFKMKFKDYTFKVWGKRYEEISFEMTWDEDPEEIAVKLNVNADDFTEAVENEMLRRLPSSPCGYDDLEWSNYE